MATLLAYVDEEKKQQPIPSYVGGEIDPIEDGTTIDALVAEGKNSLYSYKEKLANNYLNRPRT